MGSTKCTQTYIIPYVYVLPFTNKEWDVPCSCRNGICTTCAGRIIAMPGSKKVSTRLYCLVPGQTFSTSLQRFRYSKLRHVVARGGPMWRVVAIRSCHRCFLLTTHSPWPFPLSPRLTRLHPITGGHPRAFCRAVQEWLRAHLPDAPHRAGLGGGAGHVRHRLRVAVRPVREEGEWFEIKAGRRGATPV